MDPKTLKRKHGAGIVLNGGVDSHYALIEGTPESVYQATREAMEVFKPGGNFILSPSHDYLLEETPVENVLTMYDAALEFGRY